MILVYLFGDDAGIGVGFSALGGETGERISVETPGEGDPGYNRDAEKRQSPRGDESHHQPRQERGEVVDKVTDLLMITASELRAREVVSGER